MNRLIGRGISYYHCFSRVVDRQVVFHAGEKEVFRSILRKLEQFLGLRVATYCLMGNHFHLLIEVPERESIPPLTSETLLTLLPLLYDRATVETIASQIEQMRKSGDIAGERALLERYERRRGDLSIFLKELKQRVSIFMNKRLARTGTLWECRFKSLLVEGGENALQTVAAYIDLNPVRAGLVSRPEDYRWSGYGEAMGTGKGCETAKIGLGSIQREALEAPGRPECLPSWQVTLERYRRLLYLDGVELEGSPEAGGKARKGISPDLVEKVTEGKAALTLPEVLRLKVRYFCDGAVLGSAAFVEGTFAMLQAEGRIGPKRQSGARRLRGADWGELRVLRDLQVRVIGSPTD